MTSRGIYWNLGYRDLVVGEDLSSNELAFLTEFGFKRVHLWVNDQPTLPYFRDFRYAGGLNKARLEKAIPLLQQHGFKVVLTISPNFATRESLAGLAEPLAIAGRFPGTEIEFDMEGNLTSRFGQNTAPDTLLSSDQAHQVLLRLLADHAPGVTYGVSSTFHYFGEHQSLLPGAAWISPQAYDADNARWAARLSKPYLAGKPVYWALLCTSWGSSSLTPQQFESNYVAANALCNASPGMHLGTIMWSRFALQPDGTYPVGNTSVTIASAKYRAVIKRYL